MKFVEKGLGIPGAIQFAIPFIPSRCLNSHILFFSFSKPDRKAIFFMLLLLAYRYCFTFCRDSGCPPEDYREYEQSGEKMISAEVVELVDRERRMC